MYKVPLGFQEILRMWRSKLPDEVVHQRHLRVLLDLMQGDRIGDWLDHTTVCRCDHDVVRVDPQGEMFSFPDALKQQGIHVNRSHSPEMAMKRSVTVTFH